MPGGRVVFERLVREDAAFGTGRRPVTAPGGGNFIGHEINITGFGFYLILNVPAIDAIQASGFQSFNLVVPGARIGDKADIRIEDLVTPGVFLQALVTSSDQVTVSAFNATGTPVSITGSCLVMVFPLPETND